MTITYNITDLLRIAQLCDMAQIRPVSITFGDTNVSIEFTDRDSAVCFTKLFECFLAFVPQALRVLRAEMLSISFQVAAAACPLN